MPCAVVLVNTGSGVGILFIRATKPVQGSISRWARRSSYQQLLVALDLHGQCIDGGVLRENPDVIFVKYFLQAGAGSRVVLGREFSR